MGNKDNKDFNHLLVKYKPLISYYTTKYFIDSYGKEDIENIIRTVIWQSIKVYSPQDPCFYNYISKRINYTLMSLLKSTKVKKRCSDNNVSLSSIIIDDNNPLTPLDIIGIKSPSSYDDIDELNYINLQLWKVLSPTERTIYKLFINSYNIAEISSKLNMGSRSVNNGFIRIKRKAKKIYQIYNNKLLK